MLVAFAACKDASHKTTEPTGSSATPPPADATSEAKVVVVDVTPRAQQIVDAQVAALKARQDAALSATFAKGAVVLVGAAHEADAAAITTTVGQTNPHAQITNVKVVRVVAGGDNDALWFMAELEVTHHEQEPGEKEATVTSTIRATELATAASGWKVVAASFGTPRDARRLGGVFPILDTTTAGGLATMLASATQLAGALGADPAVVVVNNDKEVGVGADAARKLLGAWASRKLSINGDVREVRDAKWGFIQANVDWAEPGGNPYRLSAQLIALPKPDGSWTVVAVQLAAI